ncbi:hypothetical protein OG756_37070 [Streptomyces sp. NBC_01310]|uniref:hypothetical protein n=1 Tax=Streptomyces sp. NBC_01310 TaxID=2903820 RepID=UPI0035B61AC8|nr:hypothetical protein OG756_37070 [Streptomyces sp. NBC_01310]
MKNRLAGAVLAVAALAAPLAVVAPTTAGAAAAACSSPGWGPYDPGYSYTVGGKTSPLRTGPNADCGVRKNVPASTEFSIDCQYVNGSGNV